MSDEFKLKKPPAAIKGRQERFDRKVLDMLVAGLDNEDGTGRRELIRNHEIVSLTWFYDRWPDFPYRLGASKIRRGTLVDLLVLKSEQPVWQAYAEMQANYPGMKSGLVFTLGDELRLPPMLLTSCQELVFDEGWVLGLVRDTAYRIAPLSAAIAAIGRVWRISP